jgi:opacity protein-like surface antigen
MSLSALFVAAAVPAFSQVVPEATEGGIPLVVGVGYSNFYTDWSGRLSGPALWIDWNLYGGPSFLRGLGIEAEARDLNYDRTGGVPNLRQDSLEGGPLYTWRRYHNVHPYAKFLMGYGSIDFTLRNAPYYHHDSRTMYTPAGGVEVRAWRNVWVRGDYEYQFWNSLFNNHDLNPQGFTVGVSYDLRHIRGR